MRHVLSLLLALLLTPVLWVLTGAGLGRAMTGPAGPDRSAALTGLALLLLAGVTYAVLLLPRLSPVGPFLAGTALLGVSVWALLDRLSFDRAVPADLARNGWDLPLPAQGVAVLLAVPLLATVVSPARWAGRARPATAGGSPYLPDGRAPYAPPPPGAASPQPAPQPTPQPTASTPAAGGLFGEQTTRVITPPSLTGEQTTRDIIRPPSARPAPRDAADRVITPLGEQTTRHLTPPSPKVPSLRDQTTRHITPARPAPPATREHANRNITPPSPTVPSLRDQTTRVITPGRRAARDDESGGPRPATAHGGPGTGGPGTGGPGSGGPARADEVTRPLTVGRADQSADEVTRPLTVGPSERAAADEVTTPLPVGAGSATASPQTVSLHLELTTSTTDAGATRRPVDRRGADENGPTADGGPPGGRRPADPDATTPR